MHYLIITRIGGFLISWIKLEEKSHQLSSASIDKLLFMIKLSMKAIVCKIFPHDKLLYLSPLGPEVT